MFKKLLGDEPAPSVEVVLVFGLWLLFRTLRDYPATEA
jgi:hypothetical protein